ncbi:MAG: 50S ribosomal protein L6 [Candidatus Magasanikbacteria bacterium CG10_big_fil_rev_8_21_14_0_10_40_10]|uniref:Large ribosomal subunit protein uL6 n=1 Tax=Candidatus Magasanikbacteria bacterium CG10_big_fil_rev_8_21_14_0_10_40_10 TaxID=1974648 RepID=A0A2M6W5G0_9BACT|nr:MAG: 50S ribosomal protein L6 [Candidatus Magasanikbacteria bacterium CG10_big_fil_rev_8_21_14_0_10_40_10]
MSRIGKIIRKIPANTTVNLKDGVLTVKGPKGQLAAKIHPLVNISVGENQVTVLVKNENLKEERSLWGTFSSLIAGMLKGVSEGYRKQLEINGVGYKVKMQGKDLALEVGYSHPVIVKAKDGIEFSVEKNIITIQGVDKQLVGEVTANIRKIRKPEPYKGKGIKYIDEIIKRKVGKTAAKGA